MILAAALEIIDRGGADALSMRRLARALNRDPMILYRHAPNKAALLDGVAETVLAHPHVVPLLVARPLATPVVLLEYNAQGKCMRSPGPDARQRAPSPAQRPARPATAAA